jgi:hypothetical protein
LTAIQHSSATNEHYTRPEHVEPARKLLHTIDLDPASCLKANETVKATNIFTEADDGLHRPWYGNVFLNPPGGKMRKVDGIWRPMPRDENGKQNGPGTSSATVWWDKLVQEWAALRVRHAFFVGFTLEILRTSQADWVSCPVQRFPRCYPADRMRFAGNSPGHANVLVYLPPPEDFARGRGQERLEECFSSIGFCEGGAG